MYTQTLSAILRDVLHLKKVEDDDNFFSLGGDSIRAIEVVGRIQDELGLKLELIDILKHPSVRALNEALVAQSRAHVNTGVAPVSERTAYRTSPVQRGLYLLERVTGRQEISNLPVVLEFEAGLDPALSEKAFSRVWQRHEILRTTFTLERGALVQIVRPPEAVRCPFVYTDLGEQSSQSLQLLFDAAAREPFDLETGPPLKFHLVRLSESSCVALLSIHHIVSDSFSVATIENDFRYYYDEAAGRRVLGGGASEPQPLAFQYKDYVYWLDEWAEGPDGKRSLAFWADALAGYDKPGVFDSGASAAASFASARVDHSLDAATLAKIQGVSAEYEVTLFVVLQCCIKVLLFLRTGRTDIVIGTAVTTRDSVPLSGQIGPFVNVLPIRTVLSGETSFERLLTSVNNATLAALAHKLLPLETLAEKLMHGSPLFDVGFTLQKRNAPARPERALTEGHTLSETLGVKLLFVAYEGPRGVDIRIRYQTAHFSRDEVREMAGDLIRVINALCDNRDAKFADLFKLTQPADAYAIELNLE